MRVTDPAGHEFIACGMYAFDDELRAAWQSLFTRFIAALATPTPIAPELVIDGGAASLRDPALLLGHTCGYPLMTAYAGQLQPVAAPVFEVEGCDGKLYSSRFVVRADGDLDSLEACRGRVAAINGYDSNSGMNLLRHAIAPLAGGTPFFARVDVTGGHLPSVAAVADGRADVAAIDCITLQLIADADPALSARVRVIGDSARCAGLPFVVPTAKPVTGICAALDAALAALPPADRERLHLAGFAPVTLDDYAPIVEFETAARDAGYPTLR